MFQNSDRPPAPNFSDSIRFQSIWLLRTAAILWLSLGWLSGAEAAERRSQQSARRTTTTVHGQVRKSPALNAALERQARGQLPPSTPPVVRPLSEFRGRETSVTVQLTQPTTYTLPAAGEQFWNSRIVIANTGTSDIINPHIVVNGARDWFDTPSILREAASHARSEAEIPYRLWEFLAIHTYHGHASDAGPELHDPVKFLNAYGFGLCDDHAANLELLWKAAGYQARSVNVGDHVVAEVKLDGHWRMMDANLEMFYPSRRHSGLASVDELLSSPAYLRSISGGFSDIYSTTQPVYFDAPGHTTATMAMVLRPGESLERAWYNWGKFANLLTTGTPTVYGNGRLHFSPSAESVFAGMTSVTASRLAPGGLGLVVQSAKPPPSRNQASVRPTSGKLSIEMNAPYPFVGGFVEIPARSLRGNSIVTVFVTRPDQPLRLARRQDFTVTPQGSLIRLSLSDLLQPLRYTVTYKFTVNVEMLGAATIAVPRIMADVQCAPVSLPALDLDSTSTVAVRFENPGGNGRLFIAHHITPDRDLVHTHIPSVLHPLGSEGWQFWQRPIQSATGLLIAGALSPPWSSAWESLLCAADADDILGRSLDFADFVAGLAGAIVQCDTDPEGFSGDPFRPVGEGDSPL